MGYKWNYQSWYSIILCMHWSLQHLNLFILLVCSLGHEFLLIDPRQIPGFLKCVAIHFHLPECGASLKTSGLLLCVSLLCPVIGTVSYSSSMLYLFLVYIQSILFSSIFSLLWSLIWRIKNYTTKQWNIHSISKYKFCLLQEK